METRDILNAQGQKIGELRMPDGTAEEVWQERLAIYTASNLPIFPNVSAAQLRRALILSGVTMEYVSSVLNTLPEPTRSLAIVSWEYEISYSRYAPLTEQVVEMLGLSTDELNDLWSLAVTL